MQHYIVRTLVPKGPLFLSASLSSWPMMEGGINQLINRGGFGRWMGKRRKCRIIPISHKGEKEQSPPPLHFRHIRKSPSYFVSNDLNYGRSKKKKKESRWGSVSVRWLAPPSSPPFLSLSQELRKRKGVEGWQISAVTSRSSPPPTNSVVMAFSPPPLLLRRPKVSISFFLEKGLPGVGVEIEPYLSTCLTEKDLYHYIFFPCQLEIEFVKSNA